MKINWKVRFKKKSFWIVFIPALLLLAQQVGELFGFHIPIENFQDKLLGIVATVFSILVVLGIVTDPTTKGISDSEAALRYHKPRDDSEYL